MKVLHICNNFIVSAVHQKMVDASRRLGIQNTVFAPVISAIGRVTPHEDEYAVECVTKLDRFVFYHKQEKTYRALKATVPVEAFDLIHTHCIFSDGNVARRLKWELGIPYLVTINNTDLNAFFRLRRFLRPCGILVMKEASHIIFISEVYRQSLFQKYVPQQERETLLQKTHIIPFGIDDFWFDHIDNEKKHLLLEKKIRLLFVGDICKNKNISTVVAAVSRLREEGWDISFTIVGKILDKRLYRELSKAEFLTYGGEQTKETLIDYYRQSDIFIMPSFTETFGLVYAEALSQGVPVIYSQGQGFDGQFQEGVVGYHVDPYSMEAVAESIVRIAKEYDTIQPRCAVAARKFSWMEIARQYEKLYQQMLGCQSDGMSGHCKK